MGEIGFSRDKFLYALKWWEIKAIIDGYRKRERTYLLMTRWSTFMIMCTGNADMNKAGIRSATDLMKFPWEKNIAGTMFTDEDIAEINKLLNIHTDDQDDA